MVGILNNDSWIDSVDIALIGTHGGSDYDSFWGADHSSVVFSTGSSDSHMHPGEVYNLWGDYNLEWIALDCCSVLRDSSAGHWSHAMNGLHQILGFKNTMYVWLPGDGKKWGQNQCVLASQGQVTQRHARQKEPWPTRAMRQLSQQCKKNAG